MRRSRSYRRTASRSRRVRNRVIILDKSAFECISSEEAIWLGVLYFPAMVPTFVFEILADLAKPNAKAAPSRFVEKLARKLGGSGPPINKNYRELCAGELMGLGKIPMTGQVIADGMEYGRDSNGETCAILGVQPLNEAIMRWADGYFSAADCDLALRWRSATSKLNLLDFLAELRRQKINLPRPRSDDELAATVDGVLANVESHGPWLSYFLDQLQLTEPHRRAVMRRWNGLERGDLREFAPYTFFCLRALLFVLILWVHKMTKLEASNMIDVQYLYYLPFTQVFSSRDGLHRRVAPHLLRGDQQFLWGDDLKSQLGEYGKRRRREERG